MTKKQKIDVILQLLDEYYPDNTECYLNYTEPYELLFATILSAQCTDDRVNIVTETLFKRYRSLEDFAYANSEDMENCVKSTGFYRNKTKNIIWTAQILLDKYAGQIPSDIVELTALPGVGRKTANVVRSHIFNLPSIVVDTHVKRVSCKLGITEYKDPEKIEFELMKVLPTEYWIRYNTQIIAHGRKICKARKPCCGECFLDFICPKLC